MQCLLDSHIAFWWLCDRQKLSHEMHEIIADKNNLIFVSSLSIWELMIKKELKGISVPANLIQLFQLEEIRILPFTAEEALGVVSLPKLHRDPFDRALISQAKLNNLVFVTVDKIISKYPIVCICD